MAPKKIPAGIQKKTEGKAQSVLSAPLLKEIVMFCKCKESLELRTSKAGLEYWTCSIRKWSPDTGSDGGCDSWFKASDIKEKSAKPCKDCFVVSKWPCKCQVLKHPKVIEAEKKQIHCKCPDQLAGIYLAHKGEETERVFANCKKRVDGKPACRFWTWVDPDEDEEEDAKTDV